VKKHSVITWYNGPLCPERVSSTSSHTVVVRKRDVKKSNDTQTRHVCNTSTQQQQQLVVGVSTENHGPIQTAHHAFPFSQFYSHSSFILQIYTPTMAMPYTYDITFFGGGGGGGFFRAAGGGGGGCFRAEAELL